MGGKGKRWWCQKPQNALEPTIEGAQARRAQNRAGASCNRCGSLTGCQERCTRERQKEKAPGCSEPRTPHSLSQVSEYDDSEHSGRRDLLSHARSAREDEEVE